MDDVGGRGMFRSSLRRDCRRLGNGFVWVVSTDLEKQVFDYTLAIQFPIKNKELEALNILHINHGVTDSYTGLLTSYTLFGSNVVLISTDLMP